MNPIKFGLNNQPIVSSVDIARAFGRPHDDVLKSIRKVIASGKIGLGEITESNYMNSQNKSMPCFSITEKGFMIACPFIGGEKAINGQVRIIEEFMRMRESRQESLSPMEIALKSCQAIIEHERQLIDQDSRLKKLEGLTKQLELSGANELPSGYMGIRRVIARHGYGLSKAILLGYVVPYYNVKRDKYMVFHAEGGLIEAQCLNIIQFKKAVRAFVGTLTQVSSKFCESDILPEGKRVAFITDKDEG